MDVQKEANIQEGPIHGLTYQNPHKIKNSNW